MSTMTANVKAVAFMTAVQEIYRANGKGRRTDRTRPTDGPIGRHRAAFIGRHVDSGAPVSVWATYCVHGTAKAFPCRSCDR